MEVRKALFGVAVILSCAACSNTKTSDSVFNDNESMNSKLCAGQKMSTQFIVQWEDGRFTVETAEDAETFKREFIEPRLSEIRKVEYDRVVTMFEPMLSTAAGEASWGQTKIEAEALWNLGHYGEDVLIGVVDSQVDTSHPQLSSRIAYNQGEIPGNGIDDDRNGHVDDYAGQAFVTGDVPTSRVNPHGTHVAGIIAAEQNRGPMSGVAPRAKVIPSAFISSAGTGGLGDAIMAMQYVASRGARIINASWGGAPCVASLRNAFVEMERAGILVVVAAGNAGRDLDRYPEYPASFNLPNQITVAAMGAGDLMTSWSNSGFGFVSLAAPGSRILSTIPGNAYDYFDGTSMAAPFVSGAAAVLWGAYPHATMSQVRQAILTSVDVSTATPYRVQTRGRLNLRKAYESLTRQLATP